MSALPSPVKSPATGLLLEKHQVFGAAAQSGSGLGRYVLPSASHHHSETRQDPSSRSIATSECPSPLKSPDSGTTRLSGNAFGSLAIGTVGPRTPVPSAVVRCCQSWVTPLPAS